MSARMSVSMTLAAVRDRTKTVTRRLAQTGRWNTAKRWPLGLPPWKQMYMESIRLADGQVAVLVEVDLSWFLMQHMERDRQAASVLAGGDDE